MGIPLAALAINQNQPSPIDTLGRALQLKSLAQNQAFQQQAQPLELERERQATASGNVDLQMKQMALKNSQIGQAAFSDPNFQKDFAEWNSSRGAKAQPEPSGAEAPTGGGSAMQLHPLAQFLAEKKGLPMFGPGGALEVSQNLTSNAQKIAELAKTQGQAAETDLNNHNKKLDNFNNLAEPVLSETDAAQQDAALKNMQIQIAAHPELYPHEIVQNLDKFGTVPQLAAVANTSKMHQMMIEDAQKRAQLEETVGKSNPQSPFYAPSETAVALGTAPGAKQIVTGKAKEAATKAAAEAAAKMPYEIALKKAEQAIADGDPKSAAQLLVSGDVAPSQLISARKPEFAQKAFQEAHDLSGGTWSAQKAEADFNVAKSQANTQFFGSANSLINKGGTLDQLAAAGKDIPQNQIPVFNTVADAVRAATGSGPIARYAAVALGVADDYAKVMGGGTATDTGRLEGLQLVPAKGSPEQRAAAIEGIRGAVNSQRESRIGANPILQKMYGANAAPAGGAVSAGKITRAQLAQEAQNHNVSVEEAERQAKAAKLEIVP